ncbi:MAG: hypothetical protein Q8Q80_01425 [Methyloversatilis sp.]|uniref:hypothetical protein n=1 Tax=Methyloversatilis sp. TaxID=2569862 RepID=UPI0027356DA8|nr:hypothetical protein [Methyloversatilis sp.]MDP3871298.1 hypothetical protein [Methyloversatilis sp.]
MRYINDFDGASKKGISAVLDLVRRFDVMDLDVVQFDIENTGSAALTSLRLFGRASPNAPMRDITPVSWTSESALMFQPPSVAPTLLAAGAATQYGINVTSMYQVEIHAAGAGAVLVLSAGGYKVQP